MTASNTPSRWTAGWRKVLLGAACLTATAAVVVPVVDAATSASGAPAEALVVVNGSAAAPIPMATSMSGVRW